MKRIVIAFLIPIAVMLLAPGCSMPGSTDASFCPRPTVIGDVEAGSVVADHGFVTARVTLTAEHPTVYIDMSGCAAYRTFAVSAGDASVNFAFLARSTNSKILAERYQAGGTARLDVEAGAATFIEVTMMGGEAWSGFVTITGTP